MKILFVGLGSIGQRHLRNLRYIYSDDIEIIAYRSLNRNTIISEDMRVEYNVNLEKTYNIKIFTDYSEALEQNLDAVFITNPTSLHIPTAIKAAEYDCHLFIEKPLSNNVDGVDKLIKVVKDKNLITLIGYQLRFNPCFNKIQQLLEHEEIGQILSVSSEFGEYLPNVHPYEDYRKSYASREEMGGGVLLSLSHEFDYLYKLFGIPRRLFAVGGNLTNLETNTDDVVDVLMDYNINNKNIPVHVHLDFIQRPPSRKCEIIGEEGKIYWDYNSNIINVHNINREESELFHFENFQRNNMYLTEIKHFINCIKENKTSFIDVEEGMESLKMCLAAKESLKSSSIVNL